ncbi:ATP-binding protein [Scytonema sp. PRP1]|uniref:ATP-binding protein n=1 Tax=Scytonema sp. PRP1 TaxID=3120513 RepID=UPI002FD396ED
MLQNPLQSWLSLLLKGAPLSRVLVGAFLLQILLAMGLTAWLSIRNGQKAVNDVAGELRREVANRVEQKLQTYLSTPSQVTRSNQNTIDFGLLNMQNLSDWEPYMVQQLELFDPMTMILAVANEQREFLALERVNETKFLLRKAGKSTGYDLATYEVDYKNGKQIRLLNVFKKYDARSRPFYQVALKNRKFSFSEIFADIAEPTLLIGASQPIYNKQNQLLGVTSTLIALDKVDKFLDSIRVGKSGQVLILDRSGRLVANSTPGEPFEVKDGKVIQIPATESEDSLTQATAQHLISKFGNFSRIKNLQQLKFRLENEQQFLDIRPLQSNLGVDWLIAVIVPEKDFMEQIDRNNQITILLCLGAFGLATLLGIFTARRIAQPIHHLSSAAKELALRATNADFGNGEPIPTVTVQGINELEVLTESFNQMGQQLRASFAALATANDELEQRVELRTQELQEEVQERIKNEQRLRQYSLVLAELANHRAIADGDLETAFKVITEKAANALEVERVSVWLYNSDLSKLQCANFYERSIQRHSDGMERNAADHPVYFQAIATARTIAVTDTRTDPRVQELWDELLEPQNIISLIDAPIIIGGEVVGMVFHEQVGTQPREWELTEQNFVGSIADFVALTLEVYERKMTEAALREAKEAAEVANRAKSSFLANMSHELRTPLNAILGITEALSDEVCGPVTEEQRKSLTTLEKSGKHLLELINDILDLAKIEAGKMELQLGLTSVQGLCDYSLSFVKQIAFKKKIQLSSQVPEGIKLIQVDERRIRQALINLLSNAVKFTPDGGKVWIEVQTDPTAELIHFTVVDTGIGIAPEKIPNLFQPFVQLETSYTRRFAGTGLGLSLIRRIVELHNGTVSVESEVGLGSRFTMTLPWKEVGEVVEAGEAEEQESREAGEENTPKAPSSPLLLLAEDNEANVFTMTQYLQAHGYRILLAKNGREAVEMAKRQRPDLILMDVQMPEMDGLEATRLLRLDAQTARIPIIALTSFVMATDREQVIASGVDDYIPKPVSLKELIAAITKNLSKQQNIY